MGYFTNVNGVKHRIKVKLYPNYLPQVEGAYIARTSNEGILSIEQVCAALVSRAGFKGDYETMVDYVKKFYDEVAYQICDGFAVNNGYYSIHPNIGGTLNSPNDAHNNKKNPISFRFRSRAMLNKLVDQIAVEIEGIADANGYIDEFLDYDKNSVNSSFVSGNQFCISGYKIKIAGDDPACGVYFVPVDDPSRAVKVARIAENNPSKITGIVPETRFTKSKIEIRTQYNGSNNSHLKIPRVITSSFIIEAA